MPGNLRRALGACSLLFLLVVPASAQVAAIDPDTVRAGRFDMGRMWTFEYAPLDYFSESYGFTADAAWLSRARLAVLRVPGCSASFVSTDGLVVTNHHCVRNAIVAVTRPGESLLDDGFVAAGPDAERRIPGYYADQLIAIEDVSAELFAATDAAAAGAARQQARAAAIAAIEARLRERHAGPHMMHVQIVPLYHGGRYSAYVFRRFTDVRLVAAAELQTGYFGGDADNFTYPRYALDFAFLRVYDEGRPYRAEHHFAWGAEGVREGDAVFVIGNPGPTNRLTTMAQLAFFRDVMLPAQVALFGSRLAALRAFHEADPERADALNIRNRAYSISNTLKAATGRLDALHQPLVMARRAALERQFLDSLRARPALQQAYGDVLDRVAAIQQRKAELAPEYAAFLQFGNAAYWPATLRRGIAAHALLDARAAGASADTLAAMTTRLLRIGDNPPELEAAFLAGQFTELQRALGEADPIVRLALGEATPEQAAAALVRSSVLADSARSAAAVAAGRLAADDAAVALGAALAARHAAFAGEFGVLATEEAELQARLGRARFEIFGTSMPPDGTFSPRIADGVVSRYEYNGTVAPPYTTFFGMYDRFHSFGPQSEWALPPRWLPPPPELDLATPLNFVSTTDTYGGNSGSPAVTPTLRIVGLNFDRNIQGLSRDYIFLPERGRNVMVDVRAIGAALGAVYGAHHILLELETGRVGTAEAAAGAARNR